MKNAANRTVWLALLSVAVVGCSDSKPTRPVPPTTATEVEEPGFNFNPEVLSESSDSIAVATPLKTPLFIDRAVDLGVDHQYQNGASGKVLMVEALGGGAAWTDIDRDGLPDLYFTQGGRPAAERRNQEPGNALFRATQGRNFYDVSSTADVADQGYGQGVSAGDFDSDGFDDLYVTNVGPNVLYKNMGDGTFASVTTRSDTGDARWSSSAAWADPDLDGDLDLYVCNYLQYDPLDPLVCEKDGVPALCHPRQITAWPDEYFENQGDGTFVARAEEYGLSGPGNKGLGVAIADFDGDARPDVYVCNDTTANFLFKNNPDGTFERVDQRLGLGLSAQGNAQASMGIAVGDYDANGFPDIYLTHFTGEANALYRNEGEYGFQEVSGLTGVRKATFPKLGFGTVMTDFNFDGKLDILTANGHIDEINADGEGFRQTPQLMTFDGRSWVDCSESGGAWFQQKLVGRAVATGDMDNDGDLDVVIANQNDPATILENLNADGHWLSLRCIGRDSNRNGIHTRVEYECGSVNGVVELVGGTSYCAGHQPLLSIGLGEADDNCSLSIQWPSGVVQTMKDVGVDQRMTIVEPRPVSH